jgi:GGDEF domain-containing protein
MIIGIAIGLAVGAAGMLAVKLSGRKSIKDFEERINTLQSNLSTTRLVCQEADAKHTRFELEIRKHRDLAMLFPELVKQVLSARTPDELARLLARAMNRLTGCERIAVFLADVRGGKLGLVHAEGLDDLLRQPMVIKVGDGHVGFAAETGMVFDRKALESESELTRQRLEKSAIPGFIPDFAAPMTSQGILYGVICLLDVPASATLPRERLRSIAAVGAAALESIRLMNRYESAADMDSDTGLPGEGRLHPVLTQELERVRRFDSPLAVMELAIDKGADPDRFKVREFMSIGANHLKATMRNIDTGLRTGVNRITLLLPGTGEEGAVNVMQRLLDDLPMLRNDVGEDLGTVKVRFLVVMPGGSETPEIVLETLAGVAFTPSGGH